MSQGGFLSRLRSSIADSGSKKFLLFVGVVIVGAVGYAFWTPSELPANPGNIVGPGGGQRTVQGGTQLTPEYSAEIDQADGRRMEEAERIGGSFVPTIKVGAVDQKRPVLIEDKPEPPVPPAPSLPRLPEVEQRPIVTPTPAPIPIVAPPSVQNEAQIQRLGDRMLEVVRRQYPTAEVQYMYSGDDAVATPQGAPSVPASVSGSAEAPSRIQLPLPGTIVYATLVGRANSDAPGPILARILQGPLSGATLIGNFSTGRDSLIISFNRITVGTTPEGEEINETTDLNAVAVDTKYLGTAMATSVDRHLLQKIGIGFASAFAQGFGQAVAQSNTTTTVRSDGSFTTTSDALNTEEQLLSAGGQAIGSTGNILMQEFGNRPTTVIVESGTPIGVLFL